MGCVIVLTAYIQCIDLEHERQQINITGHNQAMFGAKGFSRRDIKIEDNTPPPLPRQYIPAVQFLKIPADLVFTAITSEYPDIIFHAEHHGVQVSTYFYSFKCSLDGFSYGVASGFCSYTTCHERQVPAGRCIVGHAVDSGPPGYLLSGAATQTINLD